MSKDKNLRRSDDGDQSNDLGMNRAISRRDFLNGVALTIGGTLLPPAAPDR